MMKQRKWPMTQRAKPQVEQWGAQPNASIMQAPPIPSFKVLCQVLHWGWGLTHRHAIKEETIESKNLRKRAKIRNQYNQTPHLTQNTHGKVTTSQLDITNESQEVRLIWNNKVRKIYIIHMPIVVEIFHCTAVKAKIDNLLQFCSFQKQPDIECLI